MRILVCGSRTWGEARHVTATDRQKVEASEERFLIKSILDGFDDGPFTLIAGMAKGADSVADDWAKLHPWQEYLPFPADWAEHRKAAGPIRNQRMLAEGRPTLVLAYVDKPLAESRGTLDMVTRARKAGIPTFVTERL